MLRPITLGESTLTDERGEPAVSQRPRLGLRAIPAALLDGFDVTEALVAS
jgi:hypothetical protein